MKNLTPNEFGQNDDTDPNAPDPNAQRYQRYQRYQTLALRTDDAERTTPARTERGRVKAAAQRVATGCTTRRPYRCR
jgi:hypothetical protein